MTTDAGAPGAPRFDVVLRGYDRRQVDEHIARLQRVLSRMRADLDLVRSQPIPVVPPADQQPGGPRPTPRPRSGGGPAQGESPDMIGSFTDRMQSILQAAEEEAAEIRNKARASARAEEENVRAQLADLVRQRDLVLAELTRLRGQLEGLLAAPTARISVSPREVPQTPTREVPQREVSQREASQRETPSPGRGREGAAAAGAGHPAPASGSPERPGPRPNPSGAPARPVAQPRSTGADQVGRPGPERVPADAPRAAAPPAAAPRPANGGQPSPARPSSPQPAPSKASADAGDRGPSAAKQAAHRLPTGAYPTVGDKAASMRPRTEPEPEPADLFRPASDGSRGGADRNWTAGPRPGGEPQVRDAQRRDPQNRDQQSPPNRDPQNRDQQNRDQQNRDGQARPPARDAQGRDVAAQNRPPAREAQGREAQGREAPGREAQPLAGRPAQPRDGQPRDGAPRSAPERKEPIRSGDRTTAVASADPNRQRPGSPGPAPVRSAGAEATVKVNVAKVPRPPDATVLSAAVEPGQARPAEQRTAAQQQGDGRKPAQPGEPAPPGTNGNDHAHRSTSGSRSG